MGFYKAKTPMQIIPFIILFSLILISPSAFSTEPVIPDFDATYDLTRAGITYGENRRTFKRLDDGRYQFESSTRSVGFAAFFIKDKIYEKSLLRYSAEDNRLLPESYHYARSGKKARHVDLSFDREKNKVVNRVNDDPWVMDIPKGALDKLSYQLQIMLDAGEKESFSYPIADGGKLKQYEIARVREEMLETAIGRYQTLVLRRKSGKRETTIWCAPALNYLPLKIMQREKDGGEYYAEIKKLNGMQQDKP